MLFDLLYWCFDIYCIPRSPGFQWSFQVVLFWILEIVPLIKPPRRWTACLIQVRQDERIELRNQLVGCELKDFLGPLGSTWEENDLSPIGYRQKRKSRLRKVVRLREQQPLVGKKLKGFWGLMQGHDCCTCCGHLTREVLKQKLQWKGSRSSVVISSLGEHTTSLGWGSDLN